MSAHFSHRSTVALELHSQVEPGANRMLGECPACQGELDLQQPDPGDPTRLLAICLDCTSWFLVQVQEELDQQLVISLPQPESIRRVLPLMAMAEFPSATEARPALGA